MEQVTVRIPVRCGQCDKPVPPKDIGIRRSEIDGSYELSIACHGELEKRLVVLDVIAEEAE